MRMIIMKQYRCWHQSAVIFSTAAVKRAETKKSGKRRGWGLQLICLGCSQHQARPRIIVYLTNLTNLSADMIHPKTTGRFWHLSEINILDIFCDKLLWHMPSLQAVVLLIWIYSSDVQMHCTELYSPNDAQSWAWATLYLQNLVCIEFTVSIYLYGVINCILGYSQRSKCSTMVFCKHLKGHIYCSWLVLSPWPKVSEKAVYALGKLSCHYLILAYNDSLGILPL